MPKKKVLKKVIHLHLMGVTSSGVIPERNKRSLENWISYCCGSGWQGAAETTLPQPDSVCTAHREEKKKRTHE